MPFKKILCFICIVNFTNCYGTATAEHVIPGFPYKEISFGISAPARAISINCEKAFPVFVTLLNSHRPHILMRTSDCINTFFDFDGIIFSVITPVLLDLQYAAPGGNLLCLEFTGEIPSYCKIRVYDGVVTTLMGRFDKIIIEKTPDAICETKGITANSIQTILLGKKSNETKSQMLLKNRVRAKKKAHNKWEEAFLQFLQQTYPNQPVEPAHPTSPSQLRHDCTQTTT